VLAAVAAVPGALLVVRAVRAQRAAMAAERQKDLANLAERTAERLAARLELAHGALATLSDLPAVLEQDGERCSEVARLVSRREAGYVNVGAVALDGTVFCSALPLRGEVRVDDRAYFRLALAARATDLVVGEYATGRLDPRPVLHVAHPARDAEGRVRAVVYASIGLAHLDGLLDEVELRPGEVLTVIDRNGTVLSRRPGPPPAGGAPQDAPIVRRMLAEREGAAELAGLDGVTRMYAFVAMRVGGAVTAVTVSAGLPRSAVRAAVDEVFGRTVIVQWALVLLGLAAAALLAEFALVRRLRKLTVAVARISGGDRAARTGVRWTGDEIGALARAFDQMAESIERDVSERTRLQRQLEHAQKMEAVGRLAGGIAHDFNNLLTVILGAGQWLADRVGPAPELRQGAEEIVDAANRAAALTRQLLAFSRKQIVEPRVVDPNELLARLEKLLARLLGEDVRVELALAATGRIRIDPGHLEQVVVNLAVNARDAMPGGGLLAIATRDVELAAGPEAGGGPSRRWVAITVRDEGVGMDEETQARIFEPFFTTKERGKGTGLGLSTVWGIVKQAGGDVRVASAPGRGSSFELLFPRAEPGAEREGAQARPADLHGTGTVLLVEDDGAVRAVAARVLRAAGYAVVEAPRGEEALRRVQGGEPVDVVLTDLVLPDLDGAELAARLRAVRSGLAVVFMSGYAGDARAREQVLDRSATFVQKPFTPDELLGAIRRARGA
jgi:signal transduction histidine kinase